MLAPDHVDRQEDELAQAECPSPCAEYQGQGIGGLQGHPAGAGEQAHRGADGRVAPVPEVRLVEKVVPLARAPWSE